MHLYSEWVRELTRPITDIDVSRVVMLENDARRAGVDLLEQTQREGLLAASAGWDPDLHPRGKDGKFIEVLGWVMAAIDEIKRDKGGKGGFKPTGKKIDTRGQVVGIVPDPKNPGKPDVRVQFFDKDGKPSRVATVKPEFIESAPDTKARLDAPKKQVIPHTPAPGFEKKEFVPEVERPVDIGEKVVMGQDAGRTEYELVGVRDNGDWVLKDRYGEKIYSGDLNRPGSNKVLIPNTTSTKRGEGLEIPDTPVYTGEVTDTDLPEGFGEGDFVKLTEEYSDIPKGTVGELRLSEDGKPEVWFEEGGREAIVDFDEDVFTKQSGPRTSPAFAPSTRGENLELPPEGGVAPKLDDRSWEYFEKKFGISRDTTGPKTEEFLVWMNNGYDPRDGRGRVNQDDPLPEWSGDPDVDRALTSYYGPVGGSVPGSSDSDRQMLVDRLSRRDDAESGTPAKPEAPSVEGVSDADIEAGFFGGEPPETVSEGGLTARKVDQVDVVDEEMEGLPIEELEGYEVVDDATGEVVGQYMVDSPAEAFEMARVDNEARTPLTPPEVTEAAEPDPLSKPGFGFDGATNMDAVETWATQGGSLPYNRSDIRATEDAVAATHGIEPDDIYTDREAFDDLLGRIEERGGGAPERAPDRFTLADEAADFGDEWRNDPAISGEVNLMESAEELLRSDETTQADLDDLVEDLRTAADTLDSQTGEGEDFGPTFRNLADRISTIKVDESSPGDLDELGERGAELLGREPTATGPGSSGGTVGERVVTSVPDDYTPLPGDSPDFARMEQWTDGRTRVEYPNRRVGPAFKFFDTQEEAQADIDREFESAFAGRAAAPSERMGDLDPDTFNSDPIDGTTFKELPNFEDFIDPEWMGGTTSEQRERMQDALLDGVMDLDGNFDEDVAADYDLDSRYQEKFESIAAIAEANDMDPVDYIASANKIEDLGWAQKAQLNDIAGGQALEDQNVNALRNIADAFRDSRNDDLGNFGMALKEYVDAEKPWAGESPIDETDAGLPEMGPDEGRVTQPPTAGTRTERRSFEDTGDAVSQMVRDELLAEVAVSGDDDLKQRIDDARQPGAAAPSINAILDEISKSDDPEMNARVNGILDDAELSRGGGAPDVEAPPAPDATSPEPPFTPENYNKMKAGDADAYLAGLTPEQAATAMDVTKRDVPARSKKFDDDKLRSTYEAASDADVKRDLKMELARRGLVTKDDTGAATVPTGDGKPGAGNGWLPTAKPGTKVPISELPTGALIQEKAYGKTPRKIGAPFVLDGGDPNNPDDLRWKVWDGYQWDYVGGDTEFNFFDYNGTQNKKLPKVSQTWINSRGEGGSVPEAPGGGGEADFTDEPPGPNDFNWSDPDPDTGLETLMVGDTRMGDVRQEGNSLIATRSNGDQKTFTGKNQDDAYGYLEQYADDLASGKSSAAGQFTPKGSSSAKNLKDAGLKDGDIVTVTGQNGKSWTGPVLGARSVGYSQVPLSDPKANYATELVMEIDGKPTRVKIRNLDNVEWNSPEAPGGGDEDSGGVPAPAKKAPAKKAPAPPKKAAAKAPAKKAPAKKASGKPVPTPDDVWKSSELDSMPDPTRPGDVLFRNNDGTYEAIPFDEATDREDDDLGEWITPGTLIEKPGPRKAQLREWSDQRLKWAQQEDQSYLNSDLGYPAVRTQKQKNVNDINMELARREGKDVGDFDAPAPVKKAPAKKAPAKKASAKAAPPKLTDPDVKQLLADTEANFREDGVDYSPEELMRTRSSQLAEEIAYAVENGDNWITLKVPSGSEQSIPLKLAQAFVNSNKGTTSTTYI